MQYAQPVKVLVLTDDHESTISGVGPNRAVWRWSQADVTDMKRSGVKVGERPDDPGRQVLIEKQPEWALRRNTHNPTLAFSGER